MRRWLSGTLVGAAVALAFAPAADASRPAAQGETAEVSGLQPLMKAMGDTHWSVRETAIAALVELEDARAVAALRRALRDAHARVREAAADGLDELRDR